MPTCRVPASRSVTQYDGRTRRHFDESVTSCAMPASTYTDVVPIVATKRVSAGSYVCRSPPSILASDGNPRSGGGGTSFAACARPKTANGASTDAGTAPATVFAGLPSRSCVSDPQARAICFGVGVRAPLGNAASPARSEATPTAAAACPAMPPFGQRTAPPYQRAWSTAIFVRPTRILCSAMVVCVRSRWIRFRHAPPGRHRSGVSAPASSSLRARRRGRSLTHKRQRDNP